MHSRIFQVSKEPINEDDYISESTFYDSSFIGEVADYVNEDTDRADDIAWLKDYIEGSGGIEINEDENTITIVDKRQFFERSFNTFKELLEKLADINIVQFSRTAEQGDLENSRFAFSSLMYDLECEAEGDKFGFYIYDDEDYGYPTRLDEWVRSTKNGDKYYFGATIDYHS